MATSIKKPVGNGGKNDGDDVRIVQTLLNKYIAGGYLGSLPLLTVDGNAAATIPYIEEFQRKVLFFGSPDGRVDPLPGKTMTRLLEPVVGIQEIFRIQSQAITNAGMGPVADIEADLWQAAMQAMIRHAAHPQLRRPHLITLVDFRLGRDLKRLWTVDLETRRLMVYTWVAHGTNSGGRIATSFGDGDRKSSLGSYLTLGTYLSDLGHLNNKPAMKIEGLERGINGRTRTRGVVFHGADYVKKGNVGNSWGCFATPPEENPLLVDLIRDGTFVFAYHPSYVAPAAS